MSWLSLEEIAQMGFARVDEGALLSSKASYYNCSRISIGAHSRIDDFCVLSAGLGGIDIGHNVHVAVYSSLIGAGRIQVAEFANLSSRVSVYSSNDDYSGDFMTNPTVPAEFTNVASGPVLICKHVIIGSGSIILPNLTIGLGAAVGAMSLVKRDVDPFTIVSGVPARSIGSRRAGLLQLEQRFLNQLPIN